MAHVYLLQVSMSIPVLSVCQSVHLLYGTSSIHWQHFLLGSRALSLWFCHLR